MEDEAWPSSMRSSTVSLASITSRACSSGTLLSAASSSSSTSMEELERLGRDEWTKQDRTLARCLQQVTHIWSTHSRLPLILWQVGQRVLLRPLMSIRGSVV